MNTGLSVGVALHTDGAPRTFARARIGLGALTTHGQAPKVPDATMAFDTLQPLEIKTQFPPQVALDDIFAVQDGMDDLGQLLLGEVFRADGRVHGRLCQDDLGIDRSDSVDVAQ